MSAQENLRIVEDYFEALNAHDYDRASTYHGQGYQFLAPELAAPVDNEGNRAHLQQMIDMCPDLAMDVKERIANDEYVVVNFNATGTNDGSITMPDGKTIPPTGKRVSLPVSSTLQFRDGKIVRLTLYYNIMTMLEQLGLTPGA